MPGAASGSQLERCVTDLPPVVLRSVTDWRAIDKGGRIKASGDMDNDLPILDLLPARLKEARRAQGLSLDAVAKLSGVSRSMVSQIERGESSPTIATLWNLTRALQVDFAGLLDADAGDKVGCAAGVRCAAVRQYGTSVSHSNFVPARRCGWP